VEVAITFVDVAMLAVTERLTVAEVLEASEAVPKKTALYWWLPGPGINFRVATPADVIWATSRDTEYPHEASEASQKVTCPWVRVVAEAKTLAVRVTTEPAAKVSPGVAPEVTARVVVVAVGAA
jgi:hypothetical protein